MDRSAGRLDGERNGHSPAVTSGAATEEGQGSCGGLPPWLRPMIRLGVGVGLIAFLISQSDVSAIKQALVRANPILIVVGYLLNLGLMVASAFRWRVFLEGLEIDLPMGSILKLTFVGAFFNAFLPTGVGGDAYKAFRVRSQGTTLAVSFASVLLDRLAGVAMLATLGFLAAVMAIRSDVTTLVMTSLALAVGVLALVSLVLLMGQNIVGKGQRTWFGIRPRLRSALDAAANAIRRPSVIRRSSWIGLACQILAIAGFFALARSLDLGIPLEVLTAGVFTATVVAAIPITINGLGIREAVWVWGLGLYGVSQHQALAFALLVLGVTLATSAIGGLVYALAGGDVSIREEKQRRWLSS